MECEDDGFHKEGEIQKFKDHPELLPAFWHPAAPKIAKLLMEDPEAGLKPVMCLRFGGECTSSHPDCMRLRGWDEEAIKLRGKRNPTGAKMGS